MGKLFVAGTRGSQGHNKAMNGGLAIGGEDNKVARGVAEESMDAVGTSLIKWSKKAREEWM